MKVHRYTQIDQAQDIYTPQEVHASHVCTFILNIYTHTYISTYLPSCIHTYIPYAGKPTNTRCIYIYIICQQRKVPARFQDSYVFSGRAFSCQPVPGPRDWNPTDLLLWIYTYKYIYNHTYIYLFTVYIHIYICIVLQHAILSYIVHVYLCSVRSYSLNMSKAVVSSFSRFKLSILYMDDCRFID